ncbi:hypothetical protein [Variovorax sp. GT1P44]|uniref:hypothetical protein n=1 Tax=Variovorax sp. GT1P44 TaxID=3443742 RepID=UPI003F44E38A
MNIQRFNNRTGLMNPEANGLYVRYEDHCAALSEQTQQGEALTALLTDAVKTVYINSVTHPDLRGEHCINTAAMDKVKAAWHALSAQQAGTGEPLRDRLQQKCSDWGTYWRAPDAHGVELTKQQAVELLADALGVEVEIKDATPKAAPAAVSERDPFDDESALHSRSDAWFAVVGALNQACPDWMEKDVAAIESAPKAIRAMGARLRALSSPPPSTDGAGKLTPAQIGKLWFEAVGEFGVGKVVLPSDILKFAEAVEAALAAAPDSQAAVLIGPNGTGVATGTVMAAPDSRAAKYLRIIRNVRAIVDEWPEVEMPGSPLSRIRTIVAFAAQSPAAGQEDAS